jgi:hypothetical protein
MMSHPADEEGHLRQMDELASHSTLTRITNVTIKRRHKCLTVGDGRHGRRRPGGRRARRHGGWAGTGGGGMKQQNLSVEALTCEEREVSALVEFF